MTVAGAVDRATGMIVDLGALDRVLTEAIVAPLHGRVVNEAFDEFRSGSLIPTCEEMARVIAERVARALLAAGVGPARAKVTAVRIAEDDTLSASWTVGE